MAPEPLEELSRSSRRVSVGVERLRPLWESDRWTASELLGLIASSRPA